MRVKLLKKFRKKAVKNIGFVVNMLDSILIVPDKTIYNNSIGFNVYDLWNYQAFFKAYNINPDDKIVLDVKAYIRWYIIQTARKQSTNKRLLLKDPNNIYGVLKINNEDKYKIL